MTTKKTEDDKPKADNAEATTNAPTSVAAKAGKDIPPPPKDDDKKASGQQHAKADHQTAAGANGDFEEPGSTLNPADPNAPNYRFQAAGDPDALNSDQSIDHGTAVQPVSPLLASAPTGGGTQETEDGLTWTDEETPRGRVIAVTKGRDGQPTTTFEETLPAGANDSQVSAAKERMLRRLSAA